MSLTVLAARNEILTRFKTVWDAGATSGIPVFYDDVPGDVPQGADGSGNPSTWLRIQVRHGEGRQIGFGDGKRRLHRLGVVTAQLFTASGTGLSTADPLVTILLNAFEGASTPGGVWFRNARVNEVGQDGGWYQTNVLVEFNYDEVK